MKCLKICDEKEISSIAFPALGAGNLGYPTELVAKVMTNTVQSYLQISSKTTCIKIVKFVIFMDETYKAFQTFLSTASVDDESASVLLETDHEVLPGVPNTNITRTASSIVTSDGLSSSKINPPIVGEDLKFVAKMAPIKLCKGQLLKEKV